MSPSSLSIAPPRSQVPASAAAPSLALMFGAGMVIWLVLSWAVLVNVWTTGAFIDTDDAMRAVELRDWLAGQNWFDLTATRMDPPSGVAMHWARLFDVPLAALVLFFRLFSDADHAERLMRLVFPGLLFFGELFVAARLATRLIRPEAAAFAIMFTAFSTLTAAPFLPGAIDHHGAQALVQIALLLLTINTLETKSLNCAVFAGVLTAISLEISVENLPCIAVTIAAFGLIYAVRGADYGRQLQAFAISLAVSCVVVFIVSIAPKDYGRIGYDAYSITHVGAACLGAAGFLGLSVVGKRLSTVLSRFVALAGFGGAAAALTLFFFPGFLKDPLIAVWPLVRDHWLNNVMEARPLLTLLRSEPMTFLPMAIPMALGTFAIGLAAWRTQGLARMRWAVVLGFALIAVVGTFWQVRVIPLAMPIFTLGGVWACMMALDHVRDQKGALVKILPILLAVPFADLAWSIVLPQDKKPAAEAVGDGDACFTAAAFKAFSTLPKGNIMSLIDPGPHFLAFTDHTVVTGPFHRDNRGLALTIQTWKSSPEEAQKFAHEAGATYLTYCDAANEFQTLIKEPASLAANLKTGKVPDWLVPIEVEGTPYKVFAVK